MSSANTLSAAAAFGEVAKHAEKIRNDAPHRIEVMDVGDAWAQGDILITRERAVPPGCVGVKSPSRQLAPGDTQGSRHVLSSLNGVKIWRLPRPTPLDGPVIESPLAEVTIEHPEHGNVTLPCGVYSIIYERAFADELRRVLD